jgi:glycosyltransferase involved in cell wall biosynthesis
MRHKQATHPDSETVAAERELLRCCRTVDIVDITGRTTPLSLALRGLGGLLTADPLSVSLFRSGNVRAHIRRLMRDHVFDVVHLDTIGLAEYLSDTGRLPSVMTHHGAESFMIQRRIAREPNVVKKLFFVAEWLMLRRYERRMCPRVSRNVVMSDLDRAILREIAPDASFEVVDNGVDVQFFTPVERAGDPAIIFAGRLDQYSNREGILFFLRAVWPLVRAAYPTSIMHVIGMNPPSALADIAAQDDGVKLHGFVPDVRPYFAASMVAICPVRDGGGTRIKVLDALAQGIATVSTTIGCEGIDVQSERDILIADSPEEFLRQIGRVFSDPALRSRLSENARHLAVNRYSWDVLAPRLIGAYQDAIAGRPSEREVAPG